MRRFSIAVGVVSAALACPVAQASSPNHNSEAIGSHLETASSLGLFTGSVLVASCSAGTVFEGGFGYADQSWNIPNQVTAKYRIASITKQFTAATILRMAEKGDIDLDAKISAYLPDYPPAVADQVTVHQLLSNTSGIPNIFEVPGAQEALPFIRSTQDVLDVFQNRPLDFAPGSKYTYSNSNYDILGAIIERVSKKSYGRAMNDIIFEPLEMANTGHYLENRNLDNLARGYSRLAGEFVPTPYFNSRSVFAAGMAYSTARDLHTFNCALHSGAFFASEETLTRMVTPQYLGSNYGYGQALDTLEIEEKRVWKTGHGGDLPGIATQNWYLPEEDLSIIVLANTEGNIARRRALEIAHIYFGKTPPSFEESPRWVLMKTVREKGIDQGLDLFKQRRAAEATADLWNENVLNFSGYELMEIELYDEALALLQLAADTFPASANAWDSLGEAQLRTGRADLALASYEKALSIDPALQSAQAAVDGLKDN
ncbi:serine hydrolase [Altererythrobacter sp. ZODW24]|uniref:serine hydrolase n=1 Tax=Altererythrobacter sp. ZODW24 TaxID=2185142 RepID=UPI0013B427E8|nr:serine hydrolase [Altererythrobacter sp. ZODW24]